jgi:hypothetical protein
MAASAFLFTWNIGKSFLSIKSAHKKTQCRMHKHPAPCFGERENKNEKRRCQKSRTNLSSRGILPQILCFFFAGFETKY